MNEIFLFTLVMLGGGLGAIARYLCQVLAARTTTLPGWVPIAIVNVLGSFIIGFAAKWIMDETANLKLSHLLPAAEELSELALSETFAFVAVGFCGAFTTFSTFSLDNFFLSIDKKGQLLANAVLTTCAAYGAVALGWLCGQMVAA